MRYVGIQTQIQRNNFYTLLLLLLFPAILLGMVWIFLALVSYFGTYYYDEYGNMVNVFDAAVVNDYFLQTIPWVIGGVAVWFLIAYCFNSSMVRQATGARPLERRENPRVYNIVENLCIAGGMDMPKVCVVDDPQLNAFASGIDRKSYTVTVTTGLLKVLNDEELAGVIGHELTHIRNHDTRLLITSIIFVGIVSAVISMVMHVIQNIFWFGGGNRHVSSDDDNKNSGLSVIIVLLIGLLCSAIAYVFVLLTRFAISRKREFMADAGGAELCQNPLALASALRKISNNPGLGRVEREDVAQLFIIHPRRHAQSVMSMINGLFATHPSTEERIRLLEQF